MSIYSLVVAEELAAEEFEEAASAAVFVAAGAILALTASNCACSSPTLLLRWCEKACPSAGASDCAPLKALSRASSLARAEPEAKEGMGVGTMALP